MGAGKSTLINEILCVEILCETSGSQSACTQVAVSYHHYAFAGQKLNKSELHAEVDLLTETDCNVQCGQQIDRLKPEALVGRFDSIGRLRRSV